MAKTLTTDWLTVSVDEAQKVITIRAQTPEPGAAGAAPFTVVLQDGSGNSVRLRPEGIAIESSGDITLSAAGEVRITGTNVTSEASVGFVAKGQATAELSAAGQTTVRGAMVMIN